MESSDGLNKPKIHPGMSGMPGARSAGAMPRAIARANPEVLQKQHEETQRVMAFYKEAQEDGYPDPEKAAHEFAESYNANHALGSGVKPQADGYNVIRTRAEGLGHPNPHEAALRFLKRREQSPEGQG